MSRFFRVRVGSLYPYHPVFLDKYGSAVPADYVGKKVRVVNQHGCPKANTMGHCYVADAETGKFLGMVCTNSLERVS